MMNQEQIGKIIKDIRKKNNLTQKEFAKELGVTFQAVSKWENGLNIPDIEILTKISKQYGVSLDNIITGENREVLFNKKTISAIIIVLLILGILFLTLKNDDSFKFKTLSTNCDEFKITGSISYNNSKTSIFISNINYCNGDDKKEYREIECSLYESEGIHEKKISACNYDSKEPIKLEDYLKEVEFAVDDYKRTCSVYSNESLYLKINAREKDGVITSYTIPLELTDLCNK